MNDNLTETFVKARECYEKLADELVAVDEMTLTSAQVEVEHLIGYISSLEAQVLDMRADLAKMDTFIKVAKDTINKTQRAISQAIKNQKGGF